MKPTLAAPVQVFTPAPLARLFPCATNTLGAVSVAVYLIPFTAMLEHDEGLAIRSHVGNSLLYDFSVVSSHNVSIARTCQLNTLDRLCQHAV